MYSFKETFFTALSMLVMGFIVGLSFGLRNSYSVPQANKIATRSYEMGCNLGSMGLNQSLCHEVSRQFGEVLNHTEIK